MKSVLFAAAALSALALAPDAADARAGGCIKYGVGGAIVGHFAGGHGLAGAAAGCALGAYKRHEDDRSRYDRTRDPNSYDGTTGSIERRRQVRSYGY